MVRRQQQIIDASIDLIYRHGYVSFSIGALANELGVSKGVITYHFKQKEQIIDRLVQDFYENAALYIAKHLDTETSSWAALQSYIRACLLFAAENRKAVLAITEVTLGSRDEKGKLRFVDAGTLYQPIVEILDYGKNIDGNFRQFDSYIMARLVRATIDNLSGAIARGEVQNVNKTIEGTLTIFYHAVKKENL